MNLNLEEEHACNIWGVLKKIKKELLVIAPDLRVDYILNYSNPDFLDAETEMDIIMQLSNAGIIDDIKTKKETSSGKPLRLELWVSIVKFEELYKTFLKNAQNPNFDLNEVLWGSSSLNFSKFRELAEDSEWQDIKIKFLNKEDVHISGKRKSFQASYNEMGFQNSKNKKPDVQWKFLETLARHNGELSWQNNQDVGIKDIAAVKKRKQHLSENLQKVFGIYDDVFYPYEEEKAYKIKLSLEPESDIPIVEDESAFDDLNDEFKRMTHS